MQNYSIKQSLWIIVAGLSFAIMTQCIKEALYKMGIFELSFYRSLGGLLFIGIIIAIKKQSIKFNHYKLHFWRGAWGTIAILLWFFAISKLVPSTAYALNYLSPIIFILLTAYFLKEHLNTVIFVAVVFTFLGVVLLLNPNFTNVQYLAAVAGIIGGACAAMAFLMIRKLGKVGETGARTVFFFNFHGLIFAGIVLLFLQDFVGINFNNLGWVIGVIVSASIGQLALTQALHWGTSAATAVLSYSGVVFTVLIDAVIKDIDFALTDYLGFIFIIVSGSVALILVRKTTKINVPL